MLTFISNNLGSLLVFVGLLLIVSLIVFFRVRARRRGKASCGCGCKSCPMAGKCHEKKGENK